MRTLDRILVVLLLSMVGFAVVFVAHPPAPKYFPLERAWHVVQPGEGPGMGWYGRSGAALVAGAILAGIAWAVTGRKSFLDRRGFSTRTVSAITVIVMATMLLLTVVVVHEQKSWFAIPARPLDSLKPDRVEPEKTPLDVGPNGA
ncbi:MAG: hypothetical protein AMXMBFR82_24840 [Candidatus Hydrogenedentota bacterium]